MIKTVPCFLGGATELFELGKPFNPIDEDGLLDMRDTMDCDIVAFANSDCGDPIYLRPGSTGSDTVYITHHDDPGHVEVFAESVAVMLERVRRKNHAD